MLDRSDHVDTCSTGHVSRRVVWTGEMCQMRTRGGGPAQATCHDRGHSARTGTWSTQRRPKIKTLNCKLGLSKELTLCMHNLR